MSSEQLELQVGKAAELIESATQQTIEFEAREGQHKHDVIIEDADVITDLLEEAQQILLEIEVEGLPDQEAPPAVGEGDEVEEPEAEEEEELTEEEAIPFGFMVTKQELEHQSRQIEARVYRKAADLIGDPLTEPGQATEQQDEFLNTAAVALEAGLGSKPDPETLVALLELRVLQLEIKKARFLADLLIQIDGEGSYGDKAREWIERFDSDKKLKDRGKCFIATAACGANDAPDVLTLRQFRNEVLQLSLPGQLFTQLYYKLSPPLAKTIEHHPTLARVVRRLLIQPLARMVRTDTD
jgi:hypothetical protein